MSEIDLVGLPPKLATDYAGLILLGVSVMKMTANVTVTSFGQGAVPIEPPIEIPAGGLVVMGPAVSDAFVGGFHATFAVYVDGLRTHLYGFVGGRFEPVGTSAEAGEHKVTLHSGDPATHPAVAETIVRPGGSASFTVPRS